MDAPRVILQKRQFLAGRRIWVMSIIIIIVIIGTGIQMRMTWNRERLRGITSDAADLLNAAKTDVGTVLPSKSEFAPFIDLFNEAIKAPSSVETPMPTVPTETSTTATEIAPNTPTSPNN